MQRTVTILDLYLLPRLEEGFLPLSISLAGFEVHGHRIPEEDF